MHSEDRKRETRDTYLWFKLNNIFSLSNYCRFVSNDVFTMIRQFLCLQGFKIMICILTVPNQSTFFDFDGGTIRDFCIRIYYTLHCCLPLEIHNQTRLPFRSFLPPANRRQEVPLEKVSKKFVKENTLWSTRVQQLVLDLHMEPATRLRNFYLFH